MQDEKTTMSQLRNCKGSTYVGFLSGIDSRLAFQGSISGNNHAILDTRQTFIRILEAD